MCETRMPDGRVITGRPVHAPNPTVSNFVEYITLVHQIKIAASASRGIPNGDTIALREIVDMIKHFEATH